MKKIIFAMFICLTFAGCFHEAYVNQSENLVRIVLPPGAENFQKLDKDYWYSFTRNGKKYLLFFTSQGAYGETVYIIEDK